MLQRSGANFKFSWVVAAISNIQCTQEEWIHRVQWCANAWLVAVEDKIDESIARNICLLLVTVWALGIWVLKWSSSNQ